MLEHGLVIPVHDGEAIRIPKPSVKVHIMESRSRGELSAQGKIGYRNKIK